MECSSLLGALLVAASTSAQGAGDRALAETLFRQGRELMDAQRYDEACPKLAESQRLDPGGGTLLNLALCHERQGRLATAWAEFREALALARRDARADRIRFAEERLAAIEPELPYVEIVVPESSKVPGLVISLDDTAVAEVAWGAPLPADLGTRVLRASAPGRVSWSREVELDPGARLRVEVPPLAGVPTASPTPGAPSAVAPPGERSDRRPLAYAIGGVGIAAVAVGGYFGVRALDLRSRSDAECPNNRCTSEGVRLNESARSSAIGANIAIGAGLLAVGVAAYLLWTDDRGNAVGVQAAPGGALLGARRVF